MFVGWNFCPYWAYMGTIVTALFTFTGNDASKLKRGNRERTSVNSKKSAPDNGGYLVREGCRFYRTYHISVGFDCRTDILREVWNTYRKVAYKINNLSNFFKFKSLITLRNVSKYEIQNLTPIHKELKKWEAIKIPTRLSTCFFPTTTFSNPARTQLSPI